MGAQTPSSALSAPKTPPETLSTLAEAPLARVARVRATVAELEELLAAFVAAYGGMRQRDPSWYASMARTVGGSELAALLGRNPYSTFFDVVRSKVQALSGLDSWRGGGPACWWGTLFEDVIAAYVETDLGSAVVGSEICVQEVPGHRNSPDGYIAVRLREKGAAGELALWSSDRPEAEAVAACAALLEFKCPLTRRPGGKVPPQYVPQVWSGLAVSPPATLGLFVDSVFRKCALADLGESPAFDSEFHRGPAPWSGAVAWGLVGVFAPRLDAPLSVRLGWAGSSWAPGDPDAQARDADAAHAAWDLYTILAGSAPPSPSAENGASLAAAPPADLGGAAPSVFERALGLINRGRFPVERLPPCFADGRGFPLRGDADLAAAFGALRAAAPAGHWLAAVLPWKLLEVNYVTVARRPGFLDEMAPLIERVHTLAAGASSAPNPALYLEEVRQRLTEERAGGMAPPRPPRPEEAAELQELFDSVEEAPAALPEKIPLAQA